MIAIIPHLILTSAILILPTRMVCSSVAPAPTPTSPYTDEFEFVPEKFEHFTKKEFDQLIEEGLKKDGHYLIARIYYPEDKNRSHYVDDTPLDEDISSCSF